MRDYFFLAFNNLKRRKLRAWLTMIGIFIGIAAVVALISLGQGLQGAIEDQFEKIGSDKIMIYPGSLFQFGSSTSDSLKLTSKDLEFVKNMKEVENVVGYVSKIGRVSYKEEFNVGYIGGIDPKDIDFWQREFDYLNVAEGNVFDKGEKYKAVVGSNYYSGNIFEKEISVGSKIYIEGQEFRVIGITKKTGDPNDDSTIYIPKETLKEIMNLGDEESILEIKIAEGLNPEKVAEKIKKDLRKFRGEKEGQETFTVQTFEQLLESFSSIFGIVQAVLIGIAAISLFVGGIGIMNTMYTAVLERTKEIGTMKAVGAKNSDVLQIFLFESGLLGLTGGALGIALGVGLGKLTEYIAKIGLGTNLLQARFPWYLIVGALTFSFLIGTLSGVFPAMQASKLKPADALRYE